MVTGSRATANPPRAAPRPTRPEATGRQRTTHGAEDRLEARLPALYIQEPIALEAADPTDTAYPERLMELADYYWGWASALLVGISKTGLPGVAIPAVLLMTQAFSDDAKLAVGAMVPVLLVGDVFAVTWYRHHAQWNRLWRLFPYVVLGMVPGGILLWTLEEGNQLRPILGVLFLGLIALEICRRRFAWERVPRRWWFVGTLGLLAGFSTNIGHAAFPVMAVYLISQQLDKQEFIGTAAWFFLVVNLSKVPFYCAADMITTETLCFGLFVAPVAILGALVGVCVLRRIPQRLFDVLALSLAVVAAVHLILAS
jgi:uncharacterized membrane protein YfcA